MAYMSAVWRGDGLRRFDNMLKSLDGNKGKLAMVRAIKHTGGKARTQVKRALTRQTGLPSALIHRAIKVIPPNFNAMAFVMKTEGGDVSLKYFKHNETRKGVLAAVRGQGYLADGSFTKGGRFPARVQVAAFHGHVVRRTGSGRFPVETVKSGVVIPEEMVSGETVDTFHRVVDEALPPRVAHEIDRLLPKG